MPMRSVTAANPLGLTARRASAMAWRRLRAWGSNFSPSVVSWVPARERRKSLASSAVSSAWTRADTVDCVRPSRSGRAVEAARLDQVEESVEKLGVIAFLIGFLDQ